MRRGWKDHWDGVERVVWTAWAVAWVLMLGFQLVLIPFVMAKEPVASFIQLKINGMVTGWMILAHLFTYALMWLRRMFQKPTGKDRDR